VKGGCFGAAPGETPVAEAKAEEQETASGLASTREKAAMAGNQRAESGSRFTEAQKAHLLDLIAKWRKRLHLEHWTIRVEWDEPANEDAILSINVICGRHLAYIRVGDFFDHSPAQQENAVCHELIHCVFDAFWYEVDALAISTLRSEDYHRMNGVLKRHMERVVDHLATAFAPIDDSALRHGAKLAVSGRRP